MMLELCPLCGREILDSIRASVEFETDNGEIRMAHLDCVEAEQDYEGIESYYPEWSNELTTRVKGLTQ